MKEFFIKKKELLILVGVFALSRLIIFVSFWEASDKLGGFQNFIRQTDLYLNALVRKDFVPYCDGQPPLYTTFTSFIRLFWDSYAMLVIGQLALAFISLFFIYKISRLVLNKKLSYAVVLFMAFEPYRAWFDFLFASETVYTPLFLAALYSFFLFFKLKENKYLYISAIIFVLASLTRSNSFLLVPALSMGMILYYLLDRYYLKKSFLNFKKIILVLFVFNIIYIAGIVPWMIRHHDIYGQYALATIFSTNIYFYNAPELLSQINNTSFDYEKNKLHQQAEKDLGVEFRDYADCKQFDTEKYKNMLEYFKVNGNRIIAENKYEYAKIHMIKAIPFYLKSGYLQMYKAYTGDGDKPNISSALMQNDVGVIIDFVREGGIKFWLYFLGTVFWGLCSLAVVVNLIRAFFKKDEYFFYYAVIFGVLIYSSLVVSPFMVPRYTIPTAPLFIISLVVFIKNTKFKKVN